MFTTHSRPVRRAKASAPAGAKRNPLEFKRYCLDTTQRIPLALRPKLWEEPHAESFWELFYDLIIVVAFIRLSSGKYNLTPAGLTTTSVLFLNFWSCWSMTNMYITSFAQNDVFHRLFYSGHIALTFVMTMYLGHDEFSFFIFNVQARDFSRVSIAIRILTSIMWLHILCKVPHGLSAAGRARLRRSTLVKLVGLAASMTCFALVAWWEPDWDPKGHDNPCGRRLADAYDDHDYDDHYDDGYDCGHEIRPSHYKSIAAWGAAVLVEQVAFVGATVSLSDAKELPFPYEYAADRMQAWIMLSFGESVIGLLNDETRLETYQLKFKILIFFTVMGLCSVYFDVMQGGRALEHYRAGGDSPGTRAKVGAFFVGQGLLSLAIFFLGMGVKALTHFIFEFITFVDETGCGKRQKENGLWRRLAGTEAPDVMAANDDYDDFTWLVVVALNVVYGSCILVSYTMPTSAPAWRVHGGRLGGFVVMLATIYVASHRENIAAAVEHVDDDHCAEFLATQDETPGGSWGDGYTVTEALFLGMVLANAAIGLAHLSIEFEAPAVDIITRAEVSRPQRKFSISHNPRRPKDMADVVLTRMRAHAAARKIIRRYRARKRAEAEEAAVVVS